jgi:hypothetical protein
MTRERIIKGRSKKQRQDSFIEGFLEYGTIRNGCRVAHVDRATVHRWANSDDAFANRFSEARQEFGEKLEEVIVGIVLDPEAVKKSPILAITLLNANLPQKYRPTTGMVQEDTARELIQEWRKVGKANARPKEQKEELGDPVENQLTEILKRKGSDDTDTGEEGSR